MYEVARIISLALAWLSLAMNLWAWYRWHRLYKQLKVREKFCAVMMSACTEFLKAKYKELEVEESVDERDD